VKLCSSHPTSVSSRIEADRKRLLVQQQQEDEEQQRIQNNEEQRRKELPKRAQSNDRKSNCFSLRSLRLFFFSAEILRKELQQVKARRFELEKSREEVIRTLKNIHQRMTLRRKEGE
jgi:hypothetical protein